jgi:hypothetical protein
MATQVQSQIVGALESLGFVLQPDQSGKVGGPENLTAKDEVLDALKGKTVTVNPDGSVTVK